MAKAKKPARYPKKLSDKELADTLYLEWQAAHYAAAGIWRHMAQFVRYLARKEKL